MDDDIYGDLNIGQVGRQRDRGSGGEKVQKSRDASPPPLLVSAAASTASSTEFKQTQLAHTHTPCGSYPPVV
jgi:hypothetical protein